MRTLVRTRIGGEPIIINYPDVDDTIKDFQGAFRKVEDALKLFSALWNETLKKYCHYCLVTVEHTTCEGCPVFKVRRAYYKLMEPERTRVEVRHIEEAIREYEKVRARAKWGQVERCKHEWRETYSRLKRRQHTITDWQGNQYVERWYVEFYRAICIKCGFESEGFRKPKECREGRHRWVDADIGTNTPEQRRERCSRCGEIRWVQRE